MATFKEIFEEIPEDHKITLYYIIGCMENIKDDIKNPDSLFNEDAPIDFIDLPSDQQEVVKMLLAHAIQESFFKRSYSDWKRSYKSDSQVYKVPWLHDDYYYQDVIFNHVGELTYGVNDG